MLEPNVSSASISLPGAACAGAEHPAIPALCVQPREGHRLCLCGWWHKVPGSPHCSPPVGQDWCHCLGEGWRFLRGHLILQAPGATVTMSGACVRPHLNPPCPTWETGGCGVELVFQPLLGCCWVCTVGDIPLGRDHSPLQGHGHAWQGCAAKAELWCGHRAGHGLWEVPVSLCTSHSRNLLQAQMGAGRRDGSCGQSTCSHWFPFFL